MLRKTAWAGQFYPSDAAELERTVDTHLKAAKVAKPRDELLGLMVPHAGYVYSGTVAGHAYCYLSQYRPHFDTVVLLASAHHAFVEGVAVYPEGAFASPLGALPVDEKYSARLLESGPAVANPDPHLPEHCIEVQVPFLQRTAKGAKIIPVLLGPRLSEEQEEGLAQALLRAAGKSRTLLVASSDMSHYPTAEVAREVDERTLEAIASLKLDALDVALSAAMGAGYRNLDTALCGETAVRVMLRAALVAGATRGSVLAYANSGDVSGDKAQVVGYGAVAVTK